MALLVLAGHTQMADGACGSSLSQIALLDLGQNPIKDLAFDKSDRPIA
jgi:hypothetical protein